MGIDDTLASTCTTDAPSIRLTKTPVVQSIDEGDDAIFSLIVTNNGNASLTDVAPVDATCDTLTRESDLNGNNDNTLTVGEQWLYTCTVNTPPSDFINSASVTATGPTGVVSDQASAYVQVIQPRIDIEKLPHPGCEAGRRCRIYAGGDQHRHASVDIGVRHRSRLYDRSRLCHRRQ